MRLPAVGVCLADKPCPTFGRTRVPQTNLVRMFGEVVSIRQTLPEHLVEPCLADIAFRNIFSVRVWQTNVVGRKSGLVSH